MLRAFTPAFVGFSSMDSIEDEIINDEFDGLHNREARKKLARERFFEGREAAEVRELATSVALKKVWYTALLVNQES